MNNYFQQKKRTVSLSNPKSTKKHNPILDNSFNDRRQHFLQTLDPAFANCLLNGLYPTPKIPRETTKPITLSKLFLSNNHRIQYIVDDFSQSHLPRELYTECPKIKLRDRDQSLEGPQWSYENRPKLRKDQANQANSYNKSVIDDTAKDMIMVYFPSWKTPSKDKWKTDRGFLTTVNPKSAEPQFYSDVYIEGFEALGDISRKVDKEDLNPKEYRTIIKSTLEPLASNSIRKAMQDNIYNKLQQSNLNPSDLSTNTKYPKIYNKSIRQQIISIAKRFKED
ncbi:unnamed protein product (macronuclear) [Paramecium tetraurelia]|uniref:Uncharacterized protein n=1 Tax=Paramecium tetraurelia TaxID=5888 RepID=A0CTA4_PARTE|nr:uncharacterized protein GSPATT00010255001 [Paramecium tetraurelia]CAK74021.1 unnamed protein product [Paramecium tetraurelia]|eukprot:XP_001441418.1 hypothetical protein (macronuclear) [Paramecium tetraurelia strain d4-2]